MEEEKGGRVSVPGQAAKAKPGQQASKQPTCGEKVRGEERMPRAELRPKGCLFLILRATSSSRISKNAPLLKAAYKKGPDDTSCAPDDG